MRDKIFKFATIRYAWKEAGLAPFNPEIVLNMWSFLPSNPSIQVNTKLPKTPERRPFQHPPSTKDRPTHRRYLDQRLEDHFEHGVPLTPSYQVPLRMYQQVTEAKVGTAQLIQDRETHRIEAQKEEMRRKEGNRAWVQQYGVIYKSQATTQITEKYKGLQQLDQEVKNMKLNRTIKKADDIWKKQIITKVAKIQDDWQFHWGKAIAQKFRILNQLSDKSIAYRRCEERYRLYKEGLDPVKFPLETKLGVNSIGQLTKRQPYGSFTLFPIKTGCHVFGLELSENQRR